MKIVRIFGEGSIPSKKNSRITNRKTGKSFPSKRYTNWHKEMQKQYKEFIKPEFPTQPIRKCYKMVANIVFGDLRKADSTNKIESINDFLVDIGVIIDDNWSVTGPTTQNPSYQRLMGHWVVDIWVDENNPMNQLVNWKEFNVVKENNVQPDKKQYNTCRMNFKKQIAAEEKKKKEEMIKKWS